LDDLRTFLRTAYSGKRIGQESGEAEALAALASLLGDVRNSPLSKPGFDEMIFGEEMKNVAVFEPHGEANIDLNGWLEAQWLPDSALIISGCNEGALPARISGHPFLPDSICASLGLHHNVQRFVRDAYLLYCLLATRRPGRLSLRSAAWEPMESRQSRRDCSSVVSTGILVPGCERFSAQSTRSAAPMRACEHGRSKSAITPPQPCE
jgi:hypothetical protein